MATKSEPADKDRWVQCPYNTEHKMPQSRLQWHLVKCPEKRARGHLFTTCPFNSTHIILKSELGNHTRKCKDKALLRNFQSDTAADTDDQIKAFLLSAKPNTSPNKSEWQSAPQGPVGYHEQPSEKKEPLKPNSGRNSKKAPHNKQDDDTWFFNLKGINFSNS